MGRGPLFQSDYRPLFSGHETFPLRYGWLKKAYDAVAEDSETIRNKKIFRDDDAIARFGVGKNMVSSMRHWATCAGIIKEDLTTGLLATTADGDLIFGPSGVDPYLESPASLWYLHWLLCAGTAHEHPVKTTWYWVFSHFYGASFRRENLVEGLLQLAESQNWQRVSQVTVKRDVECFVRTYEISMTGKQGTAEDSLESPLAELGLIQGIKGNYHLMKGAKPSLPIGVFAVALDEFWERMGTTRTLSFEMIAHESGSPGRVFLLDESDLADRLLRLEDTTRGVFRWSETAGLKQVLRTRSLNKTDRHALIRKDFEVQSAIEVE